MNNKGANQVINNRAASLSGPDPYPDLMTEQELTAIETMSQKLVMYLRKEKYQYGIE